MARFRVLQCALCCASLSAILPPWPPTYQLNASTFVYACNYSGVFQLADPLLLNFGLIAIDWSHAKQGVWIHAAPMNASEVLIEQAAAIKALRPSARVLTYKNSVKALPWMSEVRARMASTPSGFLRFLPPPAPTRSARCDYAFSPPRCSVLYRDVGQTPLPFPTPKSKYDGLCDGPCDCGAGIPCGEFLFNLSDAALREWYANEYVLGPQSMGSGVVDGFFFDDAWRDSPSSGSNACDGSPVGGPSEVDSFCVADMGLRQADTTALTAGWAANLAAAHAAVNAAGGFNWNQFSQLGAPANTTAACTQFFSAACGPAGQYLREPLLFTFSEGPGRTFSPLPAFESDLAAFLLIRGPFAWLGFAWNGCSRDAWPLGGRNNQSFSFPDALNRDVGAPVDAFCSETVAGSGVFTRSWGGAAATFDCHAGSGRVEWKKQQ